MSRWLLLACCIVVLSAVAHIGPTRAHDARELGGQCGSDRDCQPGLQCLFESGVLEGQCSASCNATASCQERFGAQSVCLGVDICARSCTKDADCPAQSGCNVYNWCEGL